MISTDFSFQTNTEILSAFQIIAKIGDIPTCLILHGAGKSDKERLRPIAREFAQLGISSIGFDYSGSGSSTGNTPNSIMKRIEEAQVALTFLDQTKPIMLCGFSMSGQVIISLLEKYTSISHVILGAPGLYDTMALDIPFGHDFTSILREPESWRNNNSKKILREFTGEMLIMIGSEDNVIPTDIPQIISENAIKAKSKTIHSIQGAPHMLAGWMQESHDNAQYVGNILRKFLDI